MPSKITFDSATLADAVQKASKIAPSKGSAFDKAAGIVIEASPNEKLAVVKATDLDCSYQQRIEIAEAQGDYVTWRIPSNMMAGLVSNLPSGEGRQITLIDTGDDAFVRIKADRFTARLPVLDKEAFPILPDFTPDNMVTANDLAAKVQQVSWACETNSNSALGGVHIDGKHLVGCNKASMAVVSCEVEVEEPVTVSLVTMAQLLRSGTDVKIKAENQRLMIMLDAETKATSQLIMAAYPDIFKVMRDEFLGTAVIAKSEFLDTINRLLVLARTEKAPAIRLEFNSGGSLLNLLTLDLEVENGGRMQDSVNLNTEWEGLFEIHMSPNYLIKAFDASKSDLLTVSFGLPEGHPQFSNGHLKPLKISDDKGYYAWVMPRDIKK